MILNRPARRLAVGVLVVTGALLLALSPASPLGAALFVLGVALELVGISIERRDPLT